MVEEPAVPVSWRRVGSGKVTGRFGKVNTSEPLTVLEVSPGRLVLRVRPRLLAAAFGVRPLVALAEDALVFPARGMFKSRFVGIKTATGEGYFAARDQAELLRYLESAGFEVDWAERTITYP